jgi:hypothetical protein
MNMFKAVSAALLFATVSLSAHATSPGELRQKHLNENAQTQPVVGAVKADELVLTPEDQVLTPAEAGHVHEKAE